MAMFIYWQHLPFLLISFLLQTLANDTFTCIDGKPAITNKLKCICSDDSSCCNDRGSYNNETNSCDCFDDWLPPYCNQCAINGTCVTSETNTEKPFKRSFIYALAFIMGLLLLASALTAKQCYRMRVQKNQRAHIQVPQVVVSMADEPLNAVNKKESGVGLPPSYQEAVT